MGGVNERHVCTCGDCETEPFADTCRYEVALANLLLDVDAANRDLVGSTRGVIPAQALERLERAAGTARGVLGPEGVFTDGSG